MALIAYMRNRSIGDSFIGVVDETIDPSASSTVRTYASVSTSEPQMVKDGSTFISWNTERDGSGTSYQGGETVSGTVHLYAIWTANGKTYTAGEDQLLGIADAIRGKIPSKNLLPPGENKFTVPEDGYYTISVYVTWDGVEDSAFYYSYYKAGDPPVMFIETSTTYTNTPNAGSTTREDSHRQSWEAGGIVTVYTQSDNLQYSNWQIEKGQSATPYKPYVKEITFPDGFVDCIGTIPGVDTTDANATANDIRSGKTAYVNKQKITGMLVPLDTSDATADGGDICRGKSAYVNGAKVIGSADMYSDVAKTSVGRTITVQNTSAVTVNRGQTATIPETGTATFPTGMLKQTANNNPFCFTGGFTASPDFDHSTFTLGYELTWAANGTVTVAFTVKNKASSQKKFSSTNITLELYCDYPV